MKKAILLLFMVLSACTVGPKPIAYGDAACHYCSMTIVDKQHAAQLVTEKGKVYNFDAAECMLNHLKSIDKNTIALYLTNDYANPETLIDATEATFLISKGIPSPMGEYLTAFASKEAAENALKEHGGELYSWQQIRQKFN